MSSVIEEVARRQAEMLLRTGSQRDFVNESLSKKSLRLLYEADEADDDKDDLQKKIKKDIADTQAMINQVITYVGATPAGAELKTELEKLKGNLTPLLQKVTSGVFGKIGKVRSEQLVKASAEVSEVMKNTYFAIGALANALTQVAKDANEVKDSKEKFADLFGKDEFPSKEDFEKRIRNLFVPPDALQSKWKKGVNAALGTVGKDADSKLGRLFQTAAKFLTGLRSPPAQSFPDLYTSFISYLENSTAAEVIKAAEGVKVVGNRLIVVTDNSAKTAAELQDVATETGTSKPKVKSADLESELGGSDKAKAFIAALKANDSTKDLVESRSFRTSRTHSLASFLFEATSYADLLKIAQDVEGIDKSEAEALASKAAKFLKSKGADVDDSGAPEPPAASTEEPSSDEVAPQSADVKPGTTVTVDGVEYVKGNKIPWYEKSLQGKDSKKITASYQKIKSTKGLIDKLNDEAKKGPEDKEETEEPVEDVKAAAEEMKKSVEDAKSQSKSSSMGELIYKNIVDALQPFIDRKSLSQKSREAIQTSSAGMQDQLTKLADSSGSAYAKKVTDIVNKWYESLDDKLKAKLGGREGSKKVIAFLTKDIENNIKGNFQIKKESKKSSDDLLVERWQKLAGIK